MSGIISARAWGKVCIEPDVECEFDAEAYYNSDDPVDNQLEKAKEVLKELMK